METIPLDRYRHELLQILDETFEHHHGIYLDKGTTLFETLASVTAEEASRPASPRSASIAAHVEHATFYLRVLQKAIGKQPLGVLDWNEIWRNAKPVSTERWDELRSELREERGRALTLLETPGTWDGDEALWGSMAIAIHTAYHLGAIRQILAVVRAT
ncbi:MAG: hypothetical protein ACM3JJ_06580 [Hyphomicrobiales bacterium]